MTEPEGEDGAPLTEAMIAQVYRELHRLARQRVRDQNPGHTLQATALLNEALLRLFGHQTAFQGRDHLIASAARAMRSVLIDHARSKNSKKRQVTYEEIQETQNEPLTAEFAERACDILALDDALRRLAEFDARMAQIVELRFFGGIEMPTIARMLGLSRRTIEREFCMAREWLRTELDN